MSLDDLRDRFLSGTNKVFSRKMLGSVLLGAATSNVIDYALIASFPTPLTRVFLWSGLWVLFLLMFVFWARLEQLSDSVIEDIGE